MKQLQEEFRKVLWKQKEIEGEDINKNQELWYWEDYVLAHWHEPQPEVSNSLDASFA